MSGCKQAGGRRRYRLRRRTPATATERPVPGASRRQRVGEVVRRLHRRGCRVQRLRGRSLHQRPAVRRL